MKVTSSEFQLYDVSCKDNLFIISMTSPVNPKVSLMRSKWMIKRLTATLEDLSWQNRKKISEGKWNKIQW